MNQQTNAPVTTAMIRTISQDSESAKDAKIISDIRNYEKDLSHLMVELQYDCKDDILLDLVFDLMPMAFNEFLSSKAFRKMKRERKKEVLTQFRTVNSLLSHLDEFFSKHPKGIWD